MAVAWGFRRLFKMFAWWSFSLGILPNSENSATPARSFNLVWTARRIKCFYIPQSNRNSIACVFIFIMVAGFLSSTFIILIIKYKISGKVVVTNLQL